jgi:hypothetical protein
MSKHFTFQGQNKKLIFKIYYARVNKNENRVILLRSLLCTVTRCCYQRVYLTHFPPNNQELSNFNSVMHSLNAVIFLQVSNFLCSLSFYFTDTMNPKIKGCRLNEAVESQNFYLRV